MFAIAGNFGVLQPFFIEFDQTYLHGDMLLDEDTDAAPSILFLHGTEQTDDRIQFFLLRQFLFKQYGLSSCTFDFIGHGRTSGAWQDSNLQQHIRQANDIVDACFDSQHFSIVAVGMSAYTALKLTELAPVRHLVLLAPLVSCNAHKSDALAIMGRFQGKLCLMAAEDQERSPIMIEQLQEFAVGAAQRQVLTIPSCSSGIVDYANNNPLILKKIADSIASTCQVA
jgi:pimeloyl-ACP methyl ester carboxylesterase